MSSWTFVSGVIKVDTFARSDAEAMYLAQTVVNHLPRISGSEGPAKYYLNLVSGHTMSSNVDEFEQLSNLYDSWRSNFFETQTEVLITVDGALRDRVFQETLRETSKMLSRLSSRLWVTSCLVSVKGYQKSYVFDSPRWITDRELTGWARDLLWK